MKGKLVFSVVLVAGLLAATSCKEEQQRNEIVASPMAGVSMFGSEVEMNGEKRRLFGCSEGDADCTKRNEIVAKLGCNWVGPEDCKGCSKLDTACLERAQREGQ